MSGSSCWLSAGDLSWSLHGRLHVTSLSSSQPGGWLPRQVSHERESEPGGSYMAFCDLSWKLMQVHFYCI